MSLRRPTRGRPGTIIPMLAVALVGLFAFVALAIDLGLLTVARTECQDAADAAALAGARVLDNKPTSVDNNRAAAITAAKDTVKENYLWNTKFVDGQITTADTKAYAYKGGTTNKFILYDTKALAQSETGAAQVPWGGMHVRLDTTQTTFFAKVFGVTSMQTGAVATAVHRPRDIAFVLDFSGSMRFGSWAAWPYTTDSSQSIEGLMNPDPIYPKFGHYGRFVHYQTNNPVRSSSVTNNADPALRPNPLCMRVTLTSGEYGFAPNNHTMHSTGGPPMVWDFKTAPGDPATVDPTALVDAFRMWNPTVSSAYNTTTLTPQRYDFTGYNAATAACPAPENFETQSDSPIPYVGDKWPRADGGRGPNGSDPWATLSGTTLTEVGALTAKEFLGAATTGADGRLLDSTNFTMPTSETGYAHPDTATPKRDGGTTDGNYRDAIWEAYGYDLDVVDYRADNAGSTLPRTPQLLPAAQRFKGYSMGPMYWGKTFFVWPPDPRYDAGADPAAPETTGSFAGVKDTSGRWICDWRRRFFLRGDGQPFDPQTDDINEILFRHGAAMYGHVLNTISTTPGPGYYRLNYPAILAWIKSGPKTLPSNLRAGRILYYSSIPTDANGTSDRNKRFWREYIHYIFGVGTWDSSTYPLNDDSSYNSPAYNPNQMLAGTERRRPFREADPLINQVAGVETPTTAFKPSPNPNPGDAPNPKPYMNYADNINRPRMHLWFGPQTMLQFVTSHRSLAKPVTSGTIKEAQSWQLKAAINSVLDDIQTNHPNDYCGMAFFCERSSVFHTPRAPMGQEWYRLKNCLFYRKEMLDILAALPAASRDSAPDEERVFSSGFNLALGNMPNANGGTDPNSGLAVAFNLLSRASTLTAANGYTTSLSTTKGRQGAAKIVIFETDGVPNADGGFQYTGAGVDSRYEGGTSAVWGGDANTLLDVSDDAARKALSVITRIVAPTASSGNSGHSLPNSPARVYPIAFGDLFNSYDGTNYSTRSTDAKKALYFLTRAAQLGNTVEAYPPASGTLYDVGNGSGERILPFSQVIAGPYERPDKLLPISTTNPAGRIEKLRDSLERIMQSGVQVTLIE
jgi:Flp pilus assembly protein TadG